MSDFDQAAGFAAQAAPDVVIGRLLAASGEAMAFGDWFKTRAVPRPGTPKRTPDMVVLLEGAGGPALLILEPQSQHDPTKLATTLLEAAIFRCYARTAEGGAFRVLCGMVYLAGECPETVIDMTVKNGAGTRHEALLWEVAKEDAAAGLDGVEAGREGWACCSGYR